MLLKAYAKRTKKADTSAANIIGTLDEGAALSLGRDWVEWPSHSRLVLCQAFDISMTVSGWLSND
jgi:hypothetical protein